jgi:uncharacterized repeat protein (TIGR01451 family)
MVSRTLRIVLLSLTCVALLAPYSTSSTQVPDSLAPSEERHPADLPAVSTQSSSPSAEPAGPTDGLRVRLAVGEFDPVVTAEPAGLPRSMRLSGYPGDGTGYYLVQFSGPIATSAVDALTAAGAQVFDYIPDFAFIVKMDGTTRVTVEQMKQIRWVGLYQPAYRLPADLLAKASDAVTISPFSKSTDARQVTTFPGLWDDSPIEIVATVFRGEPLDPIIAQIEDMGGTVLDQSQTEWKSKLKLSIRPSRLTDLAAITGVRWVEEAPQWKLTNDEATDIMGVREVWDTHGLYGDGQTIAICDTGLDQGSRFPVSLHDDFEDGSGNSRVLVIHDLALDGGNDVNSGHGTHVAGSVLGNGDLSGATPSSHTYPDTAYAGMAPEANLVFQAVEDNDTEGLSGIPNDLNDLFSQAATSGATLHTNSWGSSAIGMYTDSSEEVDEYVWDHPGFTILFAASNDGVDSDADGVIDLYSLGSPASAKNAITVGASENNKPGHGPWGGDEYPVSPIDGDDMADDPSGLAAFSSRGPALDGRTKPDIVAPGTFIASTKSQDPSFSGTGWEDIDAYYMYMGGTSMATPLAAGAATIVRQYYTVVKGDTPSAALIKATLVNGATDIYPGQYGTGAAQEIPTTRPTNVAGWGRVNLERSIFPTATRVMTYTDATPGLNTSGVDTYKYTIGSSSEPFRVTLAWSDHPGTPVAAGGLVNDLDLMVTGPDGTPYYPNNASQRGASEHLTYDWGAYSGGYYGTTGHRKAVRFTPSSYPVTLETGLFYLASNSSTYPKTFNWYVYDGSAATGPNTVLASGSTTIRRLGWHPVDFSGESIPTITSGDFFLAIELPDDDLVWLFDGEYSPVDGRSWDYDGATWSNNTDEDYMFNAVVKSADFATSQDRINNLVGVDIDTPDPGVYTITVSGYNVPQGPQPYALVASGAIVSEPKPDVSIDKQVVGSDLAPGDPITFTLSIANSGALTATGVVITDVLPSEVSTPTVDSTLTITPTGAVSYTWQVEPLVEGASGVITISGWIDSGLGSDFSFVNTATISAPGDESPSDNSSSVAIGPNVGITKQVTGSDFEPGDAVTFTLTIDNSGNTMATQVTVVDDLSSEVLTPTFASTLAITPTGAFSYTWNVEPLGPGDGGTITIYGRIDASLDSNTSFTNTATISNPGDNTAGNNTSSVTVNVNVTAPGGELFLPIVTKRWPPIPYVPTLDAISNPDGDGSYTVSWSTDDLADTYILEEDDNAAFSSPTTAYSGSSTSTSISGKSAGTYYYRVKGRNSYGDGGWSGTQSVRVLPPSTFDATEDAAVYQGVSNTNFGSYADMWVGYGKSGCGTSGDYKVSRSLVKFNLSSIPFGTPISSAQLHLRVGGVCYGGNTNARTTTVYRANGDWSESSVTWNNKPGYAEAYGSASIPYGYGSWYTYDVTGLVRGWVNSAFANQGLMVRGPEGSGSTFGWIGFYTSESNYDPYLTVTYAGMDASQETVLEIEEVLDFAYDEPDGPSTTSGCAESKSAGQAVFCDSPD